MNLFIKGAIWQRNHVWHVDETPEVNKPYIMLDKDDNPYAVCTQHKSVTQPLYKWAYLSDLLPQND